ncbi:MAG: SusC/RagA family TonB-linked outer membrane protein [Prolixibacteraceae bacterium]|nr:SusC/RagA family TonB-linked outer membrane protein [Prolixibacteraceae bacterium]
MIRNILKSIVLFLVLSLAFAISTYAQNETKVSGIVKESGSNLPLESAFISISGENISSNEKGEFEINVSDLNASVVVQLPGYTTRVLRLNGKTMHTIYMVKNKYSSLDDDIALPLGNISNRDLTVTCSYITAQDLNQKSVSSLEQALQGRLMGTQIISGSGMPGSKSFINIRGLSSLYGSNDPLVMIDGMIHPINYGNNSVIEGFSHNPFDIVDINDVESVSVLNDANSYMGSNGSNGLIYVNLEQKKGASSSIVFNAYGGIAFAPKQQSLLNRKGFQNLLNEQIGQLGLSKDQVNSMYPYMNAPEKSEDYYRYNNNTNWQDEIYQIGVIQKYHMYLKGGDDIATYNISTGYLMHDGILKNTHYDRFNVRINGKVNISDKFTILPNTKVSLADSYLMEQGPNTSSNAILAAQWKSPLLTTMKFDNNGKELEFIDDIGAFNVSNPGAIVQNVSANNRNYHFITSVKAIYAFTNNLSLSTFVGIDFNNSRDNIFIPDVGLTKIDSAYNSSRASVNEFRSTQNHNQLNYTKSFNDKNFLNLKVGHRYMNNIIGYDDATDLNSVTDDFKSLGQGAYNRELRTVGGETRAVKWVSYYASADYNMQDKYYLSTALSYDVTSVINKNSRTNFYPSLSGAWRVSSEPILSDQDWINDLKLKASFSQTGNINNYMYDYSNLYYKGVRINAINLVARESIPNPDMEIEKQSNFDFGADLSLLGQTLNLSANYFYSTVNNLIIEQELAPAFGYTNYYNNGGVLVNSGFEFQFNYHKKLGKINWMIGGTATLVNNKVSSLDFIFDGMDKIVHNVNSIQTITQEGSPLYSFYGYETNGIFKDNSEASNYVGPNGVKGQAGDIRFVDRDNNNIINDLDKTVIGNPLAKLYGGLFTSIEYGNFEIKADMTYNGGNDIYSHVNRLGQSMELGHNQQKEVLNRWSTDNTNTDIPRVSVGDPYGNNVFSDRWIEKGDYLRLSNLTVSYKYPSNSQFFENLTFYATATNLLTLSPYSGLDPEFMYINNPLYLGSDYGKMPQPKTFVLGIKLGL